MIPTDSDLEGAALRLGRALLVHRARVATAESCTGGWIAKALTDVPGSSQWFESGIVAYSNSAKDALLGVPGELIAAHGAVSEPVVRAMAEGARAQLGVDLAVAVSGVAGPDGGSADKPVGTVWFAWATAARHDGGASGIRRRPRGRAPAERRACAAPTPRSRLGR